MAYDPTTDIYEHRLAHVDPRKGKFSSPDVVVFGVRGEQLRQIKLPQVRRPEGAESARAIVRRAALKVQDALGERWNEDVGWVRCPRTGVWCVVPRSLSKKTKNATRVLPEICLLTQGTNQGRWTDFHVCDRPVADGQDFCAQHTNSQRKRAEKEARIQEEVRARQERWEREDAQTAELRELWARCCDAMDIEPARRGDAQVKGGKASVDNEVLGTLLRASRDPHGAGASGQARDQEVPETGCAKVVVP